MFCHSGEWVTYLPRMCNDFPSAYFLCILLISNSMFLVQFGKHTLVRFSKTSNCTCPSDSSKFDRLWKTHSCMFFFKLHSKPYNDIYRYKGWAKMVDPMGTELRVHLAIVYINGIIHSWISAHYATILSVKAIYVIYKEWPVDHVRYRSDANALY